MTAMNPFSKYLSQWSADRDFNGFVAQWDRLEGLVVGVYRQKIDLTAAEAEFGKIWPGLRRDYAMWVEVLRPHWQATRAAGEATQVDPFQLLLDLDSPASITGNWRAMQHLPAAREAINRYLVAQSSATNA